MSKKIKPGSKAFFYWPPEEIQHYWDWCEASTGYRKQRLSKAKQQIVKNSRELSTKIILARMAGRHAF